MRCAWIHTNNIPTAFYCGKHLKKKKMHFPFQLFRSIINGKAWNENLPSYFGVFIRHQARALQYKKKWYKYIIIINKTKRILDKVAGWRCMKITDYDVGWIKILIKWKSALLLRERQRKRRGVKGKEKYSKHRQKRTEEATKKKWAAVTESLWVAYILWATIER